MLYKETLPAFQIYLCKAQELGPTFAIVNLLRAVAFFVTKSLAKKLVGLKYKLNTTKVKMK